MHAKLRNLLLVTLAMAPLAGCIVHTRARTCGPHHYWNGARCVHR